LPGTLNPVDRSQSCTSNTNMNEAPESCVVPLWDGLDVFMTV
jgi:hypothetical protein